MRKRVLAAIGVSVCITSSWAAPKPDLRADANSAADMQAEQRQRAEELQRFKAIDTNGDGYISEAEARTHHRLLESWKKTDLNSDGKIDQSEFSVFESEQQPAATTPAER